MAVKGIQIPSSQAHAKPVRKAWKERFAGDAGRLAWIALGFLAGLTLISILTANQYGFHRDELNFIENARRLDWGFVEYPPFTPFIGWIVIRLFGPSLVALPFTTALAMCFSMWLAGMMARDLGGSRLAQAATAVATITTPIVLFNTRFFSYQTFDFMFWVLAAFLILRLIQSEDPRWWLAIGAVVGLGTMNKYSMPFLAAGIAVGVLASPLRRHLKSPWLWAGVGLALLICLPNLIWQAQHDFISLAFQTSTRDRDIAIGRTRDYILAQLYSGSNPVTIVLWISGLIFLLVRPGGKPYRALGWMYLVPQVLFLVGGGRFYYMAGAYPVLVAAGASLAFPRGPDSDRQTLRFWTPAFWRQFNALGKVFFGSLFVLGLVFMVTAIPVAPVTSGWWRFNADLNTELREEIGWPEQVNEVNRIYTALPADERAVTGIITGNYGEASAINLYGPALGLPKAISPINTFWLRGYGDPPQRLIVVGASRSDVDQLFHECSLAGHTPNPYDISNEETRDHPDIFLCDHPRLPWPEFWKMVRTFG